MLEKGSSWPTWRGHSPWATVTPAPPVAKDFVWDMRTMNLATTGRAPRFIHLLPRFGRQSGRDKIYEKELTDAVIALLLDHHLEVQQEESWATLTLKYCSMYYRAAYSRQA